MELIIDLGTKAVLEFMQERLPAGRLVAIADSLPQLARLLWGHFPQEVCCALVLEEPKPCPSQPSATESALALPCADGDSAAAKDGQ